MRIKVSTNFAHEPIERQIPPQLASEIEFICNNHCDDCDAWVILSGLEEAEEASVGNGPVVFVVMEPWESGEYPRRFLRQFDCVVSPFPVRHRHCIISDEICLPWHAGLPKGSSGSDREVSGGAIGFHELEEMDFPQKPKLLSAIVSTTQLLPGHICRKAFLDQLKTELGDDLEIFGRGINPISEKLDGLRPYRFHLALENSRSGVYWSEKLPDALIGYSYPFYFGSAPIDKIHCGPFCCRLDISDVPKSIERVKRKISDGLTDLEIAALGQARTAIFRRFNLFQSLAGVIGQLKGAAVWQTRTKTIRPRGHF